MSLAFLDTVGALALWDRRDQWHELAVRAYARLAEEKVGLYTTSLVLAECANAASRKAFRSSVADLHAVMLAEGCIIEPTAEDWQRAWELYGRGSPGDPGWSI